MPEIIDMTKKEAIEMNRSNPEVVRAIKDIVNSVKIDRVKEFLPDVAHSAIGSEFIIPLFDKTIHISILPPQIQD